jgi:DNA-directed RNA polymerase
VNLTPQYKPADIYQRVADIVQQTAMKDAEQTEDEAKQALALGWLKLGIDRKVCKRPVV